MIATLLSHALAVALAATPLRVTVPHSRWLARCSSLPVSAVDDITIRGSLHHGNTWRWMLRKARHRGVLSCYRIGEYPPASGYYVAACHGPTAMRDRMAAAAECSHAITWASVAALPLATRVWIAERSTCCGEAAKGAATFRAWPCSRSAQLGGDLTVTRLDGYGPGVVAGSDPCEAYPPPE